MSEGIEKRVVDSLVEGGGGMRGEKRGKSGGDPCERAGAGSGKSGRTMDEGWRESAEETLLGIKEWRKEHPKATLTEIEEAIDQQINRFRKRIVTDVVEASSVKAWAGKTKEERPKCPDCGSPLQSSGSDERRLVTQGGEVLLLERTYGICPSCRKGLFPPG